MTRILFCHGAADRLRAVAVWLTQAFSQSPAPPHPIVIYTPDEATAAHLDQLLWSSPPTGFLPHCRTDAPLAAETPILIATAPESTPQSPCLLNLSNTLPPDYARFPNIIEIISQEDDVRLPARNRAKTYRDEGHEVQFRDLQKDPL